MKYIFSAISVFFCLFLNACGLISTPSGNANSTPIAKLMQSENYCTVISSAISTPSPTDEALNALVPLVNEDDWVEGPTSAEVTFLEYADFQ